MSSSAILIASDHNGVELKEMLVAKLRQEGHTALDLGPYQSQPPVDYTDYAHQLATIVSKGQARRGILICGTGVGMSIVANRHSGVRAALVHNLETAALTREHNDSNVLCLRSWRNTVWENFAIVDTWLGASYGEGRHNKRTSKIDVPREKVVFTNGCFDIIHSGHIELLNFAKRLGDRLVVALNSDASVKRLKGAERPVNTFADRKRVLESLRAVDTVVELQSTMTVSLVEVVQPDVVVKGGEWTAKEVRQRDEIPDNIEVVVCPLKPGYSSTAVIEHIREQMRGAVI